MQINLQKIDNISALLEAVPDKDYDKALNDAVQVILNSTKQRYMEQVSPDGKPWIPNAEFYREMKGGAAVLTGPISSKIKGGPYAGKYEFSETSKKRMKNSLIHEVESALKRATIFYDSESDERAGLHQYGGEAKLVLSSTTGGKDLTLLLDIPARPHLGVSQDDAARIEEVFGAMIDGKFG